VQGETAVQGVAERVKDEEDQWMAVSEKGLSFTALNSGYI